MKNYPTLSSMGIARFDEIRDYSLFTEKDLDVLKIYYQRQEGSLLPKRKVFKFPKSTKPFTENNSKNVHELRQISATMKSAVEELEQIIGDKKDKKSNKDSILRRVDQLEAEVRSHITEIRSLLDRL